MHPITKQCDEIVRLVRQGNDEKARAMADQLVAENPNEPEAWNTRAYFNARCRNHSSAISDMAKAISLDGGEPGYFYSRGRYLFAVGKFDEAVSDFTMAVDLSVKLNSEYYLLPALFFRADANVRLGRFVQARSDCDRIPADFQTWTDQLRTRQEILIECGNA